jgi:Spy/CpxP family protein refolding chaperone
MDGEARSSKRPAAVIPLDQEVPMVKSLLVGMLTIPMVLGLALAPADAAYARRAALARLQADLGLSDEQVQAIRQLHTEQRAQRIQLHTSLREARQSLRAAIFSNGDERDIEARTATVQQLLDQTVQLRVQTLRGVSQILSPEQREKLSQLQATGHRRTL